MDSTGDISDIFKFNVASNYLLNENISNLDKLQLEFLYKILARPYYMQVKYTNNTLAFESELEHNIKNIRPSYNIDSLLDSWEIPDLSSSIYFSIFFLNPKFDIIKKCSNPTCSSYFSVLHSNKRKKILLSTLC